MNGKQVTCERRSAIFSVFLPFHRSCAKNRPTYSCDKIQNTTLTFDKVGLLNVLVYESLHFNEIQQVYVKNTYKVALTYQRKSLVLV